MDDQIPQVTDQDRLDSAHKLFGQNAASTLATIDSIPNPAAQSDPSTRNVMGFDDPARWVIPQVDVAPTGDMPAPPPKPKGPAFLDQIQDAASPRQPAGESAPAAPQPSFLSSLPDVSNPLHQAYQDASLFDATHAAIVRRLSNQFGEPPEFVDKNLQTAKAQANAPSPAFFKSMEALYPGSSKFFQQPENMAVAHDDIPNVVQHEGTVNAASDSLSLWQAFKIGLEQSVAGDVVTGGKADQAPKYLSIPQSLAMQAGQILPDLPVMAAGAATTAPVGAALGSEVPIVGNIAGAVVAGGAGAMGAPTAAHQLLAMYRNDQIHSFPDLVNAFVQMEKQVGKQMLVGGVSSAAGLAAGPAGPYVAVPLENAVMTTAGKLVEGETPKPRDYVENLLLGLGMHAVTHATAGDAAKVAEIQDARVKQNFYDNIGSVAEQSKLRDRLPDVHSDFVGGLVKDSPFQDVYLPIDAATSYFQGKGMDIEDVAQNLGATDALKEAQATGGDIKIPLATWLEKMVGTEHYKALRNDIKFSPEDLSPNQTAAIESETRARVQDAADEALKGADVPADADTQARTDAAQRVYEDMQQKLSAAGLTGREVKYNPMLFRDFFSALADRVNEGAPEGSQVKADDLAQRFPLDVSKFETPLDRDAARAQEFLTGEKQNADTLREVSQGSRQERLQLARKALESISDLHKDDAAEAFGLPKQAVRALRGISERQGRGTYSHEEIHAAAGLKQVEGTPNTFDQAAPAATKPVAPPFYSKLTRTVEEKMGGSASVDQINGMLREVKPEERKWLGIDDFLKGKEKVSKAELLDFLRGNALEIKEVTKAAETAPKETGFDLLQNGELHGVYPTREEAERAQRHMESTHPGREWEVAERGFTANTEEAPKFSRYTLPGGENYREVLFQLPYEKKGLGEPKDGESLMEQLDRERAENPVYRSSHFEEPNVLAHTRLNDRTDAEGKKVLHVEEIQSDWHQAGRKKGYKGEVPEQRNFQDYMQEKRPDAAKEDVTGMFKAKDSPEYKAWREEQDAALKASGAVPDAPFRKNWHEFVLKRLIREAAEKGYDKIAWTTGEQQAERYDLGNQISNVIAKKNADGTFDVGAYKDGSKLAGGESLDEGKLEVMLGKDLAAKIVAEKGKDFPKERGGGKIYDGLDLKVGGEGMKGFYDKIIPEFLNKFGKKFGAKVGETELSGAQKLAPGVELANLGGGDYGPDSFIYMKDGHPVDPRTGEEVALGKSFDTAQEAQEYVGYVGDQKVHSLEITPALRKAALEEGFSLFQGDPNDPRGQISFAGRQFNIDLFKEKDVSTFLHETGHYFLEVMGHAVEGEGAGSEGLRQDYASILKFLGAPSRDEITEEQHEKFARAFEQYLSEGKAPSEGLREAFGQFKRWLTGLWKKVSFQNVDVSPEIRSVFDRMLASEDDVAIARKEVNLDREFSLDGLDDKTKAEIQGLRDRARARAEEALLKERMKETTEDYKTNLEKERAQFRDAAETQVKGEPLFKAIDQLRESLSGKDPYETADAALRGDLPPDQATEFEMLADEHGFTTAEDMARQISEAGANNEFENRVGSMVNEALRNVGAIKDPAELREEAMRAVHSDDTGELLAREREALLDLASKRIASKERSARNRTQAKLEMEAAKGEAGMILSKLPTSEAGRPQRFITQEKNAAARVARFVARGDFEKAAEAKQQQLVAHALVSESFKINEEAARHTKYIEKFMNRRGSLLDMPFGFVRQLDGLLDRFGFQPLPKEDLNTLSAIATGMAQEGQDGNAIADATGLVQDAQGRWSPETLPQFQDRRNEGYQAFQFPPEVLAAARRDSKDLTIDELRSVRETMQAIAEGGRKNDRFLNELHKVDIKEAAKQFREKVESTFGKPYEESLLPGKTEQGKLSDMLDTLRHLPDALTRTLDTVLTTCHKFDGLEEGPAKEFIYRPMAEAEARKTTRMRVSMEEMEGIFGKHYEPGEFEKYKETEIGLNGRKYTKENILSMALNWGNGGNRQRLFAMPGLDEASVRQLFTNLGKKDWDFVQDTWDHIDKYWPEIKKLEMAVRGVEPTKVEALAFKNEHGTYKGGYYPIAYDFEKSADAFQHNQSKDALFKQYSTARAATAQGHTEARVARVTRPLRLSLDVLANHHEDIIHDLEFRKSVIDLNRFLSERDTKVGITNAVGVRGYAGIQDWLKSVAGGGSEPLTAWDRAAQWFRFKTTFFNLGYRIASAPKIALENAVNTASEIGWSGTARAMKNYYLGDGSHEMVVEKSPFMRERANHLDRDMGDLIDKQRGEGQGAFQKYAFFTHAYIDQGMSFPLWADSYKRAVADHGDERLAVHQADETVKRTFMTGGGVDQASFARGSELKKAMTIAYGYQSMMWNRFSRQMFQAGLEWNNGNHAQAAATMAMSTIYTLALPAMVAALSREFLRNGPTASPQDEKKRFLTTMLEEGSPLKFVPIARDLQAFAIRGAAGEHQRDLQLSPLEGMFQSLIEPVAQAASGKHSSRFGEESVNGLSFAFGIPKQVNDVAFNFLDWQHDHGAVTWRDALSRRHKK